MNQEQRDLYYNLVIATLSFEKYLSYSRFYDYREFYNQLKLECNKMLSTWTKIGEFDSDIFIGKKLQVDEDNTNKSMQVFYASLKKWIADNDLKYLDIFSTIMRSLVSMDLYLNLIGLRAYACNKIGINNDFRPIQDYSLAIERMNLNFINWSKHLPNKGIDLVDNGFLKMLSKYDTIVLFADIRRSQDLITYGENKKLYNKMITEYVVEMRRIVLSRNGIFDKFTGDGFLSYFNLEFCRQLGVEYYDQAIASCIEIQRRSIEIFKQWLPHIRKIPTGGIGLSIGVDSGLLSFGDMENHLFVTGEPIVWANRMCSAGEKDEIIFNNIPYQNAMKKIKNLKFKEQESTTKTGESFIGYKLTKDQDTD